MEPGGAMPHSQGLSNKIINRAPKPCVIFLYKDGFYSVRLLASRQTLKLKNHSWSSYSIYSQLTSICEDPLHHPQPEGMRHAW